MNTPTIRLTTETHHNEGVHITYATTRPTRHTWHTTEIDRHPIGQYNDDTTTERQAIHDATIKHYTTGEIPGTRSFTNDETTSTATPTPTTSALIAMKGHQQQQDPTYLRGQTIIAQIRAERAARRAAMGAVKQRRSHLLTDPARSIFA